jgi:GntR family transcriptional regulator
MRLDPNSPVPLHAQAEQFLRELIATPECANGGLLPDELTLANRFGVSRGTLRAAIGRLVQEGLLERRAGVGTRVRPKPVESGIGAWRSFSREMAGKGVTVENYSQDYVLAPAMETVARALQISPETRVWHLDRVRGWNQTPVLHSRSWFHPRLGLTGREEFKLPLYEALAAATGAEADHAQEEFQAVAANDVMAKLLSVKRNSPLLLRSHTVFDASGRPIEFAEVHYVSSRFALTIELRRDIA